MADVRILKYKKKQIIMMDEQEKIERYLNGEISTAEKKNFEQEMKKNKALSDEVALSKDLMAFFKERNMGLEHKLSDLGEEFFTDEKPQNTKPHTNNNKSMNNKTRFIIPLLLLLFASITGFWYFNANTNSEKFEDELFSPATSVEEAEKMINEGMREQGDAEEAGSEMSPEIIEEATKPPTNTDNLPDNAPTKTEDKPKVDKPIAIVEDKASFKENAVLEGLIQENVRSDRSITIKTPAENYTFAPKNGVATLKFRFTTAEETPIELMIYDNQRESFEKEHRILSTMLRQSSNDELAFDVNVSLKNGLYYYVLRKKDTSEIVTISKFFVR
jgi:hypothetical protein